MATLWSIKQCGF